MPPPDALLEPTILVGQHGKAAWRQAGGSYGRSETGYFQNVVMEGHKAEVEAWAAMYDNAGATYEVTYLTGRRARLTARMGTSPAGSEIIEDVWELEPQETQKDLLEADFPNGSLGVIAKADKAKIRNFLQQTKADTEVAAELSGSAYSAYLLMKAGHTSFPVEASVIRHTRTVGNTSSVMASFSNVGRILSNASLNSLEGSGTLFLFGLPTIPTATQYIETPRAGNTPGDLNYGWRKIRPRVTRLTYNKWQIVNVYQHGLWTVKTWGTVL